jgi:hypothetical protein
VCLATRKVGTAASVCVDGCLCTHYSTSQASVGPGPSLFPTRGQGPHGSYSDVRKCQSHECLLGPELKTPSSVRMNEDRRKGHARQRMAELSPTPQMGTGWVEDRESQELGLSVTLPPKWDLV